MSSSSPGKAPQWRGRGWALIAAAGLMVGLRRAEQPYADGDVLWCARAGRDLLASGRLPRTDDYSWTMGGRPWLPNSWGWNVVLGAAHRAAGLAGIAVLGIAMTAATALTVGVAARRIGAQPAWTALIFQVVAGFFALFMYPRAQVTDYVAIIALPLLLESAVAAQKPRFAPLCVAIVAGQVFWMNLHSAAVLGPVVMAAAGAAHVLCASPTGRRATLGRVLLIVVGCAAGCLATPYGFAPIRHITAVRRASAGLITEWRPVGFGSVEQLLGLGALALGVVASVSAVRRERLHVVAVLVVLGVVTTAAIRFAPMLALFAIPELAAMGGLFRVRPAFLTRVSALALAILAALCLFDLDRFADPGATNSSPTLVAALPRGCRLLNDAAIGGDVILYRRNIAVSIDSRNDLYGRGREIEAVRQLAEPRVGIAYIRTHQITCVLAPSNAALVVALPSQSGWRVAAHDSQRTLLVSTNTP